MIFPGPSNDFKYDERQSSNSNDNHERGRADDDTTNGDGFDEPPIVEGFTGVTRIYLRKCQSSSKGVP